MRITGTDWIKDKSTSKITEWSEKEGVSQAIDVAHMRYDRNLKILKELDGRYVSSKKKYVSSKKKRDRLATIKFDRLFHKRAEILQYYSDELTRLYKIYSDKSGMPVFLSDDDGNIYLYEKGFDPHPIGINDLKSVSAAISAG